MKNQPFFLKLKKILAYPFNWEFITLQKQTIKLLDKKRNKYYFVMREKYLNDDEWATFEKIIDLRNKINQSWNLHDVTQLISVEISKVLRTAKVNMQIFDLKTKWFLWNSIFLRVDQIPNEATATSAKHKLEILREISVIYDLGK